MCEVKAEVDRSATGWEGVGEHLGAGVAEGGDEEKEKEKVVEE